MPAAPGQNPMRVSRSFTVPAGAAYTRTESSKGELGFYIIADGGSSPFRCKIRSPSYSNLHVIEKMGPGLMISDLVATAGSLDLVLGEIDR